MNTKQQRAIIYVDGFNLYYGALKDTPSTKWLDLERFFLMLRNEDDVVQINYFTTQAGGQASRKDQLTYLTALSTRPLIEIIEGRFKPKSVRCRVRGCQYSGDRTFTRLEEKRTDVNIAVRMLEDAVDDRCDLFVLVSGDSDLVPAVQTIKRRYPAKKIRNCLAPSPRFLP